MGHIPMRTSIDIQKIQKDWTARGFSFAVWNDPEGQRWENYVHDTDELFVVVSGTVELEMNGKKWCPASGQEVLIPARVTHSVRNVGKSPSQWLYGYRTRSE